MKAKNLKPINERTPKEMKEISSKGGISSGVTRRRQKNVKDMLNFIDKQPLPEAQALSLASFNVESPTFRDAVFITLYKKILDGDLRAIELYLRLKGEMPTDGLTERSLTVIWKEKRYGTNEETE